MPRPLTATALMLLTSLASLTLGCPSRVSDGLIVHLQSDLVAGVEFDRVRVEVDGDVRVVAVAEAASFRRPTQLAAFTGLPLGRTAVSVDLQWGAVRVVERRVEVDFDGEHLLNVVISRSCAGVECVDGETCIAGRCAPPACASGDEIGCPPPDCLDDADCTTETECVAPTCASGICLETGNDGACMPGERCVAPLGCFSPTAPPPRPTGLVAEAASETSVRLQWSPVEAALHYEIEHAPEGTFEAPSPAPDVEVEMATLEGLAMGTRRHFRVRTVGVTGESEWSDPASAVTPIPTPPAPGLDVIISESARAQTAGGWVDLPGPGNWYFAQGHASGSCPTGTSAEYRFQAEYTSPPERYGWTGWMGPDAYMVRPLAPYGVRFFAQVRCVGPDVASEASGVTAACRMRDGARC